MERNSGAPASAAGAATSSTSASAAAPDVTALPAAPVAAPTAATPAPATPAPAAAAPASLTSSRASQSRKNRHVIRDVNLACGFCFQILHCATTDNRPVTTLYIPDPDVTHTCRPHVDADFIHPAAERIFIDITSRCSSAQQAQDVLSNAALLADPNLKEHLSSILKKLKPSDIERFAVSRLLWVERAKAGATDLLRIASVLEGLRDVLKFHALKLPTTEGATVPASGNFPDGVAELVRKHLGDKPGVLFVGLMSNAGAELLSRYGKAVGLDGTHGTVRYENVTLITLTTMSHGGTVKSRGFAVAHFITNTESEAVHTLIASLVQRHAGFNYQPVVLMTDMALQGGKAWQAIFPGVQSLWCLYHIWAAWEKRLHSSDSSSTIDARGHVRTLILNLLKQTHDEQNEPFSDEVFLQRFDRLVATLRKAKFASLASLLADRYRDNAAHFSPRKRLECARLVMNVAEGVFPNSLLSIFTVNNHVEAFHNTLKMWVLRGIAERTICDLIAKLMLLQGALYRRALKAGIRLHGCAELTEKLVQGASASTAGSASQEPAPASLLSVELHNELEALLGGKDAADEAADEDGDFDAATMEAARRAIEALEEREEELAGLLCEETAQEGATSEEDEDEADD